MKILFLNPPFIGRFSRTSRSPAVAKGGTLYYPIWLAYAAGLAQKNGHDIRLFDAPASMVGLEEMDSCLGVWQPDMVVIDTSTPSIFNDVAVAVEIRKRFLNAFILLVGTHPSALPVECVQLNVAIDGVAIGEYDATLLELATALEKNTPLEQVAGLAFRQEERVILTEKRKLIQDLDALPFVSEVYAHHLNIRDYFFAAANYPMVQIITGRGCPHRCFFCVYPQVFHSHQYRVRSASNVVDEFEFIQKNMKTVREVGIEDDCFTASPNHVRQICTELIARGIRLPWYCNVRGDVKLDLLQLMKKAGCRLVTVGFESGDQNILDNMQKGIKLEKYLQFVKDVKQAGLMVHGCMMVGNPGDTKATLAAGYEFAVKANFDSMQFYPLYVYPGTEAYDWAKSNGYLKTTDFSQWLTSDGLHNCVLNTPELSAQEMVALCDHYLKKYHLRPRYILMKLWQGMRHPSEGYRTLLSAKTFFGKFFGGQLGDSTHD
ncbi:MAG: radical SAM protein [Magnetococcales bacterium]|nr:radical SAM protein [Magnetococcales bacterium]MBF0439134.1 radical SAM protein [Magnetococcales bacterium]